MSEELPDLTPYLSKKGGNQSNKGPAEAASKPELSQKLSALVKKPAASAPGEPQVSTAPSQAGDNPASYAPTIRPVTSSSSSHSSLEAAQSTATPVHGTPMARSLQGDSISGILSTRSHGGNQSVSPVDRLKGPQARPISSLSSGNAAPPHLAKAAAKESERPPAPYGSKPEGDSSQQAPRVGPAEPPAPTISSPRPVAPLQMPSKPLVRSSEAAQAPSAGPASHLRSGSAAAPPSISSPRPVAPLPMPSSFGSPSASGNYPQSQVASGQPAGYSSEPRGASPPAPSQSPSSSAQGLDSKELLARAFQEEQRALELEKAAAETPKNFADLFKQESKRLQEQANSFNPENDPNVALYSESEHLPQRSVGIGNLLGGTDASLPPQHTAFSDLMTRTGEHDVRFAPERREELSSFDEVKSSIQASIEPAAPQTAAFNQDQPRFAPQSSANQASFNEPAPRPQHQQAAGAAFNLFSTEIVTSGQDYHTQPEPEGGDFGVGMRESDSTYPAASAAADFNSDYSPQLSSANSQFLANYSQGLAESSASSAEEFSPENLAVSAEESPQFSPESYMQSAPVPFNQFGSGFTMQSSPEPFAQFESEAPVEAAPAAPTAKDPSSFDPNAFNIQVADPAQAEAAREVMAQLMAFQTGGSQNQAVQSLDQLKLAIQAKKDEEARAKEMEAEFNRQQQQRALQDSDQLEAPSPSSSSPSSSLPSSPSFAPEPASAPVMEAQEDPGAQRARLIAMIEQSNQAKLDAVEGTERAVNASVPEPEGALGRALSNALDKLLGEEDTPFGAAAPSVQVEEAPVVAESPAETSFESETTMKADALARLLEVASKAPSKTPDAGKAKSSAINLAEIINKPPGKVSRQMDAAQLSSGSPESIVSPFGASSPYTSPFAGGGSMVSDSSNNPSPSSSGQNLNAGYSSQPGAGYPGYSSAGSQQASMSSDAVSARMADLNRKLQEQRTKPVVTSSQTMDAMGPSDMPPLTPVGVGSSPSINSLSQIPAMDEEVNSKAELVNRILGQARITGAAASTAPAASASNLPKPPAEYMAAEQAAAVRNIKPQKAQISSRARMAGPGVHPAVIGLVVFLVLAVVGGGGYYVYSSGMLKGDLSKGAAVVEKSVDTLIKEGEYDQAILSLEAKQRTNGKLNSVDLDRLYSSYVNQAERLAKEDEEFGKAIVLLEKVPNKTKRFKEAQKMIRKYRKKVKKN